MKRILLSLLFAAGAFSAQAQAQGQASETAAENETATVLEVTAKLGTGVEDRELVEESSSFQVNDKAYLWLRLAGGPNSARVCLEEDRIRCPKPPFRLSTTPA